MFIHPSSYDINGSVCSTKPNIYCSTLSSRFRNSSSSDFIDLFNSDVYVNIDEFKAKLILALQWQNKYLEVYKHQLLI